MRPLPQPVRLDDALATLRAGGMAVLDAGALGYVTQPAAHAVDRSIAFMARSACGLVCLALPAERCDRLGLRPPRRGAPLTVTIEARTGVSTGISAADRARTIRVAVDPAAEPRDLVRPGHVVPLRAHEDGVLACAAAPEAALELAALAGAPAGAVLCAVLDERGEVATGDALAAFAGRHRLPLVRVDDVVRRRLRERQTVARVVRTRLPTRFGLFEAVGFRSEPDGCHHLALVQGDPRDGAPMPVAVQPECVAGGALRSLRCDCRRRIDAALGAVGQARRGTLLHLTDGRRTLGGCAELTPRHEAIAAAILADLGVAVAEPLPATGTRR